MMKSKARQRTTWIFLTAALTTLPLVTRAQDLPTFHSETRLVEVYATVQDHRGHYVDGLTKESFKVLDNGEPQALKDFESESGAVSCALLIDTTASMDKALPHLKDSVVKLIDEFDDKDFIAVYSFAEHMTVQQAFTHDKASAKRAALKLRVGGNTALYDALSQASSEAALQPGKKALIVLTDGDDDASVLTATAAINRAKKSGLPVFTIAEGDATQSTHLEKLLSDISKSTGGEAYQLKSVSDVDEVFQKITAYLQHMYLLSYAPSPRPQDPEWRKIEVSVAAVKDARIHSKEGYIPK